MLCGKCYGSGRVMGMGMIYEDCDCDNDGDIKMEAQPIQIDKRSSEYRQAIKKIMDSSDCTREEAVRVFETEFRKIA